MTKNVMMSLGGFRFSISTAAYDKLARSTDWRWASVNRTGREPARQFTGRGDDKTTLSGVIFTQRAGLKQVETLRELADEGKPLMMVDQYGYVHGKWCIENISETRSGFFADGAARKQEFTIQLAAYGED